MLGSDGEGCKEHVSTMKAEDRLRAAIAEVTYLQHLENLKHKECIREEDVLDLSAIDNTQRNVQTSDSNLGPNDNKMRNLRENKKKKK
jgi:hypothetical protein